MQIWPIFAAAAVMAGPVVAGSVATAPSADAAIAAERKQDEVETILLEIERNQRLTVPVTIMGQGPFRFMIDTGAQATVLSLDLAERLQLLDGGQVTLVGTTSQRQVETVIVPEFALGSRLFTVDRAPLVERGNIGEADGILGVDSLQDQRVLFDFTERTIDVAPARSLGGDRGFEIVVQARRKGGQLIIHDAVIDGVKTRVIIDTGAQRSVGNLALAEKLRRKYLAEGATLTDINGVVRAGSVKVARRLTMGDAGISEFAIIFSDAPPFARLGLDDRPALILGMSELRLFRRVAIDFSSREVLFDLPADAMVHHLDLFTEATRIRR